MGMLQVLGYKTKYRTNIEFVWYELSEIHQLYHEGIWMSGPSFKVTNSNTVQTFSDNHNSQRHSGAKENVWVPLISFGNEGLIFEQTFISIYLQSS